MPRYIICKFCKNENEAAALLLLVGKEMKMKFSMYDICELHFCYRD
jgi:hypothetical protein